MKYCILLKAINVSGKNIIKMDKLRAVLESAGFSGVQTYIQSGNIIFEHDEPDTEAIADAIEKLIEREFSISTTAFAYTREMFEQHVNENPFIKDGSSTTDALYIAFLRTMPEAALAAGIKIPHDESEAFVIHNKAVYLYCPNGSGNTKLTNNTFEKKLRVSATSRNWKTVLTLLDMLRC